VTAARGKRGVPWELPPTLFDLDDEGLYAVVKGRPGDGRRREELAEQGGCRMPAKLPLIRRD